MNNGWFVSMVANQWTRIDKSRATPQKNCRAQRIGVYSITKMTHRASCKNQTIINQLTDCPTHQWYLQLVSIVLCWLLPWLSCLVGLFLWSNIRYYQKGYSLCSHWAMYKFDQIWGFQNTNRVPWTIGRKLLRLLVRSLTRLAVRW